MEHQGQPSLYTRDGQRKYVTTVERERFIARALALPHTRLGNLCLVLAYTGCRISEALALMPKNVNKDDGTLAIVSLKKRGQLCVREVPVPHFLMERLDRLDTTTRLFPWSRGRAWFLVKQVMHEVSIEGGPHATVKGLRHGMGIHALRSNVPITLVKRWLGHARLSTTEIYLEVMGPDEREFASRMW